MRLGFIESLKKVGEKSSKLDWKNATRQVGKRTTVFENHDAFKTRANKNSEKRVNQQDQFTKFTKSVLPQLEEKIELEMLQKQFKDIENDQLKNDLIQSYIRRRVKLLSVDGEDIEEITHKKEQLSESNAEFMNVISQYPLNSMGEDDIGQYVQYPITDLEKYFKDGQMFGDYTESEVSWTKKFALMANEESLKLVEYLKHIKATHNQSKKFDLQNSIFQSVSNQVGVENVDYYNLNSSEIKQALENEEVYFSLFRQFSINLRESLNQYRNDTMFERYFATPNIFDFLVRIVIEAIPENPQLAKNLNDSKLRQAVFDNIAKQILEKGDREQCNSQYLIEFMNTMQTIELALSEQLSESEIQKIANQQQNIKNNSSITINLLEENLKNKKRNIPESLNYFSQNTSFTGMNSGAMLYGDRGSGKSGTLGYVTMWAHKNDFVVVNVPSAFNLTNQKTIYFRHQQSGLYLQNDLAKEWLEFFAHGNKDLLTNIQINKELYGKYGYSGIHDSDPEAVPNIYYKKRKAYFEDYKQFLFEEEVKLTEELDKKMEIRVSEKLPEPKTLQELVQYGIDNEWFACNVVYEVLEQLYNLDSHCVLVVVDEFNYLYKESVYPSFRYANDKELDSRIPPYHLSLCRAFVNLDGHKIKNGFKLTASSLKRMQRHQFTPKKINLPESYGIQMEGLPLDDFRMMCHYYLKNGFWNTDDLGAMSIDFLYMQTQGNWHQAHKYMIEHYCDGYLFK